MEFCVIIAPMLIFISDVTKFVRWLDTLTSFMIQIDENA